MKLVIDRSKWYRGHGGSGSRLRRSDGMQCCLGFLGAACGVPNDKLEGVEYPVSGTQKKFTNRAADEWPTWLFRKPSGDGRSAGAMDVASHLAIINDKQDLPHREAMLTAIFAEHGVEVEFIDGEP